jgi:hypothetical protein
MLGVKLEHIGKKLVINITGKDLMNYMLMYIQNKADLERDNNEYTVNKKLLIEDVIKELNTEEEDGTTLFHEMLDKVFERLLENGTDSVQIKENL